MGKYIPQEELLRASTSARVTKSSRRDRLPMAYRLPPYRREELEAK